MMRGQQLLFIFPVQVKQTVDCIGLKAAFTYMQEETSLEMPLDTSQTTILQQLEKCLICPTS